MPEEGVEGAEVPRKASDPQTSEDGASGEASASVRPPVDVEASGPRFGPASEVETALARALDAAAAAGRFDVVVQLGRELEARRLARTPNVVQLDARRR